MCRRVRPVEACSAKSASRVRGLRATWTHRPRALARHAQKAICERRSWTRKKRAEYSVSPTRVAAALHAEQILADRPEQSRSPKAQAPDNPGSQQPCPSVAAAPVVKVLLRVNKPRGGPAGDKSAGGSRSPQRVARPMSEEEQMDAALLASMKDRKTSPEEERRRQEAAAAALTRENSFDQGGHRHEEAVRDATNRRCRVVEIPP